jgi:hypothetical protein
MYTKDIIYAISILIITAWTIYKESREHKARKVSHIAANPKRCTDHAEAIAELRADVKNIKEDIKEIKDELKKQ